MKKISEFHFQICVVFDIDIKQSAYQTSEK